MKRISILALLLLAITNTTLAATVTGISNLLINGTRYDATIHTSGSFNDIWDSNGDGIFGNDASILNRAPTFWGDSDLAKQATQAVMDALGLVDDWSGAPKYTDEIATPYTFWVRSSTTAAMWQDGTSDTDVDMIWNAGLYLNTDYATPGVVAWVSYAPSAVPLPAAVWLFGSGILGLIGFSKRKRPA